MTFAGRHIVVTGASTGIGRATALMLGQRGAKVSLIARSADKLAALAAEIGNGAKAFPADVADRAALEQAIAAAEAAGLDLLVLGRAGSPMRGSAASLRRSRSSAMPIGTA